ncbi:MAG: class I SAM-dependent methyltransferase [Dethiobacter sp.]|jgi:SAM-dependent methyltransferase|nr:class I SAM-dependent methyltransferase [Dethiobacter sp.]
MKEEKAWYENDSWWQTMAPILFPAARWKNTAAEVSRLLQLTGLKPGATVLDLCCGEGRHSLELARHGFHVTGVDRTSCFLAKGTELAAAEGLEVEFVRYDMRHFCREKSFDAVINMFTSFGYFENQEDDYRVASNTYRSLKPGGIFLLDLMGKEILARIFRERDWLRIDDTIILEERKLSRNWGWIDAHWTLLKGSERHEVIVSHRLYSATELVLLLQTSGFTTVDIYGSLDGSPYDHAAARLVALARV